ncbi:hypothetical protein CERSUDRAFT_92395 [Gelatoporia subvermispora B]|uniref:Uncharacterized protein n=1 Tax=Ceriporiopsis subvermispora (strain B) TaxID=914234 RepID=M2QS34_CERS8|nr:hypothetical protein CERSUDRAFT_92395 [Gelatoporia subvermispora B]
MPQGDIEVVLPPPEPQTKHGKRTQSSPHGRYVLLRYLRRRHTIEITRHLPLQPGERKSYGEQSKKVFTTTGDNLLDGDNARKLDADEKTCLQYVLRFLRICETLEASKPGHLDLTPLVAPETAFEPNRLLTDTDTRPRDGRSRLGELLNRLDSNTTEKCPTLPNFDDKENPAVFSVPSRTNSTVIPSLNLAPRPSKFATGSTRQVTMTMAPASTSRSQRPTAGADSVPRTRTDLYETKYHPAVGWCTRLISAGEETYRIMFLDGVSLEVNIGRHSATLVTQSGEIVKSTLNEDMDTPLTIRMKSFNVFVRLFSANDKGA